MKGFEREVSSGGIVAQTRGPETKLLLIKDPYGKWTWPKGKLEKGESPLDAAKREIGEETGLKNIRPVAKIGSTNYFYKRGKKLVYKTVHVYLFEFTGEEGLSIRKSEIDDGRWYSREEALSRLGYRGSKKFVKKAVKALMRKS